MPRARTSGVFSVCFFLATGRKEAFSRAAGYSFRSVETTSEAITVQRYPVGNGSKRAWNVLGKRLAISKPIQPARTEGVVYPFKLKTSRQ